MIFSFACRKVIRNRSANAKQACRVKQEIMEAATERKQEQQHECVRVLSFDVGVIHLGYCMFDARHDRLVIVDWGIIDLLDDLPKCEYMMPRAHMRCNKTATNAIVRKKSRGRDSTKIYACTGHVNKLLPDDSFEARSVGAKRHYSQTMGAAMFATFEAMPTMMTADIVLIENQPVHINPLMKSVGIAIHSYFVLTSMRRCRSQMQVIFVSATQKLSTTGDEADTRTYGSRKKASIDICTRLIALDSIGDDDSRAMLAKYKKKDDMCDAFLQGFQYMYGGRHDTGYAMNDEWLNAISPQSHDDSHLASSV